MNNLKPQAARCFQLILVVICAVLSLYVVYELLRPYQPVPVTPPGAQDKQTSIEARQHNATRPVLPVETFSEIVERPLFTDKRRPYMPPVATGPGKQKRPQRPEADIRSLISLSAIVVTKEKRIALIEDNRTGKLQQLRQGEKFNGWVMTGIGTNSIAMQKGPVTRNIELAVKPSRTPRANSQGAKPGDAGRQAGIAAPASNDNK